MSFYYFNTIEVINYIKVYLINKYSYRFKERVDPDSEKV